MRSRWGVMALLLGVALIGSPPATYAQTKAKAKAKGERVSGTVQLVNKDAKTVLVTGQAGDKQTQVMYDEKTKVTKDNKPATMDDVTNGVRVICIVKADEKGQLHARRIDVRPSS